MVTLPSPIFLDFGDEALMEPFSEQHFRDPCFEVMLAEDVQFFFKGARAFFLH